MQRRFHGNDYVSQAKERNKLATIEDNKTKNNPSSPQSLEKVITEQQHKEVLFQERFDKFSKIHTGEKPLLILDIDNTMLYARFFSDEMRINDIVTYFGDESVAKNNAKVLKLQKTMNLEIINGALIDKLGTEHIEISLWIDNNHDLEVCIHIIILLVSTSNCVQYMTIT